ncbi:unnamed protein product, partial [Ixodes pacificus]
LLLSAGSRSANNPLPSLTSLPAFVVHATVSVCLSRQSHNCRFSAILCLGAVSLTTKPWQRPRTTPTTIRVSHFCGCSPTLPRRRWFAVLRRQCRCIHARKDIDLFSYIKV